MFWKSAKPEMNLLELIPHRLSEFEIDDEDRVTVIIPRFKSGWMVKAFIPRWKSPFIRTKLDETGSFIWQQCDGATNVDDIAGAMRERFGESIEPVHSRLKLFLQQLSVRGHIELRHADGTPVGK